jgi:hypothetical protein
VGKNCLGGLVITDRRKTALTTAMWRIGVTKLEKRRISGTAPPPVAQRRPTGKSVMVTVTLLF